MTPPITAPQRIDRITQSSRIGVESTPKYSARPPQTPAIFLSVADRVSRRPLRYRRRFSRLRNHQPCAQVRQHAANHRAGDDREDDPGGPDEHHIDVEVVGDSGADPGNLAIGSRASETTT